MWRKKFHRQSGGSKRGEVKFEVIDVGTPDFELGLPVYTQPARSFGLIKEPLKAAFETHLIDKNVMYLEMTDYPKVISTLRSVCEQEKMEMKRLPTTIETWFQGYKERNTVRQDGGVDWSRIPSKIRSSLARLASQHGAYRSTVLS